MAKRRKRSVSDYSLSTRIRIFFQRAKNHKKKTEREKRKTIAKLATRKTKVGCSREESFGNFTEDLIIEILLRLPVKSIARFRCVCKSWYNLIKNDITTMKLDHDARKGNFKLLITTRNKNKYMDDKYKVQLRTLVCNEGVKIRYPFENELDVDIQILGSCNGLICASINGYIMYVWNPCTKEYKVILSPNEPKGFRTNGNFVNKYISYGFGYDSETCDYKFVSIFWKRDMDVSEVEIYSLGSDLWRTYKSCIPYKVPRGDPGVFLNGALHWLANTGSETGSRSKVILSFNMQDEIFKEIPQPAHMDDYDYKFVDVLRGCLCLLCSVSKSSFEIWEMHDYGVRDSWLKIFKTDEQLMTALDIPSCHYLRSAVCLPNGDTLLQVRLFGDKVYYEWESRSSVVRICLEEKERHQYRYKKHMVQMVVYMESLVSVNSGTHVGDVQEEKDYYKAIKNLMG